MFDQIKELLVEEMSIEEAEIKPEAEFVNDLGFNSLEIADLISLVEEKFDLDLEEDKIKEIVTLSDFASYLETLVD